MPQAIQDLVIYKRQWFGCDTAPAPCMVWIYGSLPNGEYVPRTSTGRNTKKEAEEVRKLYLGDAASEQANNRTIEYCADEYLKSRKNELKESTIRKYRLMFDRLIKHCADHNVVRSFDLKTDLLEQFKTEGLPDEMGDVGKASQVDQLRCFLKDAFRRGWIKEPLALRVKPHAFSYEMKIPYEEDEVLRFLAGVLKAKEILPANGYAKFPKTTRLLLEFMLETGLRGGDAILFDPRSVIPGSRFGKYTFLMQKRHKKDKNPKWVEAFPSTALLNDIAQAKADGGWYSKDLPFWYPHNFDEYYPARQLYNLMQTVGADCGVEDCRPHRCRDTFAVAKLEGSTRACTRDKPTAPMSVEDVSKLLAHSSVAVTLHYYAKWTKRRSSNLENALALSFG